MAMGSERVNSSPVTRLSPHQGPHPFPLPRRPLPADEAEGQSVLWKCRAERTLWPEGARALWSGGPSSGVQRTSPTLLAGELTLQ